MLRQRSATPPSSERISTEHFIRTKARSRATPPRYAQFTDSNTHPIDAGQAGADTRYHLPTWGEFHERFRATNGDQA